MAEPGEPTEEELDLEAVRQLASHDLRAPVRHARSFAQILAGLDGLPDTAAEPLKFILDATERMQRMVDAIIGFTTAASAPLVPTTVPIETITRVHTGDYASADPPIDWQFDFAAELRADASILDFVVAALVQHGALSVGGSASPVVRIGTVEVGDATELFVEDNGAALTPDEIEALWKSRQRSPSLTGADAMGLALVRRAAQRHGGTVDVSASELGGSRLSARFPNA